MNTATLEVEKNGTEWNATKQNRMQSPVMLERRLCDIATGVCVCLFFYFFLESSKLLLAICAMWDGFDELREKL